MKKLFFIHSLISICLTTFAANVLAQADEPPTYAQLLKEKKYSAVEQRANAQLEAQANLPEALFAKLEVILRLDQDSLLDEGIKIADQCVKAHPDDSKCHEFRGRILFKNVRRSSIIDAIGLYNKVKAEFRKSLELDPKNISARYHFLQLFLKNNSIIAKSITTTGEDAKNLIIETYKVLPAIATLLQANLDIYDDNLSRAQAAALAVNPKDNDDAIEIQTKILHEIASRYLQKKESSQATKLYTELVKRYPTSVVAHSQLSRLLQEQNKHQEAISVLENLTQLEPTAQNFYRLSKSQIVLNDKINANLSLEKSINAAPGLNKKDLQDAQALVKQIKNSSEAKIN
jgi:tetratricopeptide (TPR) repeat protein